MYTHLHMFQDLSTIIMEQYSTVQTNITQFNTIQEGMNNIDMWIIENLDALTELYRPFVRERKIGIYALDHCQQLGQKEDKETTTHWCFVHAYTKQHKNYPSYVNFPS
jgi:hypothetical protein